MPEVREHGSFVPPPGWQPPPPQGQQPPADWAARIAAVGSSGRLGDSRFGAAPLSLFGKLARQKWLLWGVGPPAATLAVVLWLLWPALTRPALKPAAADTESPAVASTKAAVEQPSVSPGTQSLAADEHKVAEEPKPASPTVADDAKTVAVSVPAHRTSVALARGKIGGKIKRISRVSASRRSGGGNRDG